MTLKPIVDGAVVSAEQNANWAASLRAAGLNTVRQLIDRDVDFAAGTTDCFADAYVDSDGRENTVNANNTTATFYTNKYTALYSSVYVVIEATSISAEMDFRINNCLISSIGTGKWLLWCTTGTDEVKRAQIYKTLYWGTSGSNPRVSSTYITGLTALKTSVAQDVGKNAFYISLSTNANSSGYYREQLDFTFSNTSTNTDMSTWFDLTCSDGDSNVTVSVPAGGATLLSADANINQTGTDVSSQERNNPATLRIYHDADKYYGGGPTTVVSKGLVLSVGNITAGAVTFAGSGGNGGSNAGSSLVVYSTTHSTPALTAASAINTAPESYDNSGGTAAATSMTTTGTISVPGYFSQVNFQLSGSDGARVVTIQKNGITVATVSNNNASNNNTLTAENYSLLFAAGDTFTITTTGNTRSVFAKSAQSYTGTNFSFTSQSVAAGTETAYLVYTPTIVPENAYVIHTVPSGRLPATISSACLVPFIQDWETGADIQYKITNGSSDTGWLSCGNITLISNFTAFSTEPTTLTIKLIPKSSSPTPGVPSIRGFTLFAE